MERGIIVAFLQVKGGSGKSTLTQNLSVSFAHSNLKVKIVDCDIRQRTCSKWVSRRNEYHPEKPQVFSSIQVDDLRNSVVEDSKNYDVVIIDVQGSDSKSLRTSLLISDIVYIPFTPSQNDIEVIEEFCWLLEETHCQNNHRKTFYILNNCSVHYLDQSISDAELFFQDYTHVLSPSQIKVYNRKVYKVASSEGFGVIEMNDLKSRIEILNLKKEVESYV
ncbi:MAG: AAA family ATPase (plasmid) [Candidatus Cardinium sp.]|uniref:AAA family ATPase n=1 Tax=Cardinium endosymbiont of Dermatophagoides farinae TaxID=2597823 RepID=UPI0011832AC0|nr:AAA family ATPase [Cardinium endosymbiont of Dermatophagoides farinae]TSJ80186.1 AAA family ATPase [Cardinium endosymbiont of Dermatophagoides farinae]UWW97559.1 MAG: AAA family ATPase [Candidatus Cardinium sp.]